jgi:hypothetical protein
VDGGIHYLVLRTEQVEDGIEFLQGLLGLLGLRIVTSKVVDLSPLESCTDLIEFCFVGRSFAPVDLSRLPRLAQVYIDPYTKDFDSVFNSISVCDLTLQKFSTPDLSAFSNLPNLEKLSIWGGSEATNLSGLGGCKKLSHLELKWMTRLVSPHGIERCPLTGFHLDTVSKKFVIGDTFQSLGMLRELTLANCRQIPSLSFLGSLPRLERFFFYENTDVVDGDLSHILIHPSLRQVSFKDRKHYSHTCSQIWQCHSPKLSSSEASQLGDIENALERLKGTFGNGC